MIAHRISLLMLVLLIFSSCAKMNNPPTQPDNEQVVFQTRAFTGDCIFVPQDGTEFGALSGIAASLLSGILDVGLNRFGDFLKELAKEDTTPVFANSNFQASPDSFPDCVQFVRGKFYKYLSDAPNPYNNQLPTWFDVTGFEKDQFIDIYKQMYDSGMYLAAKPDIIFEGRFRVSINGKAVAVGPTYIEYNKHLKTGSFFHTSNSRGITVNATIHKPGMETTNVTGAIGLISIGNIQPGFSMRYEQPEEKPTIEISTDNTDVPAPDDQDIQQNQPTQQVPTLSCERPTNQTNLDKMSEYARCLVTIYENARGGDSGGEDLERLSKSSAAREAQNKANRLADLQEKEKPFSDKAERQNKLVDPTSDCIARVKKCPQPKPKVAKQIEPMILESAWMSVELTDKDQPLVANVTVVETRSASEFWKIFSEVYEGSKDSINSEVETQLVASKREQARLEKYKADTEIEKGYIVAEVAATKAIIEYCSISSDDSDSTRLDQSSTARQAQLDLNIAAQASGKERVYKKDELVKISKIALNPNDLPLVCQ